MNTQQQLSAEHEALIVQLLGEAQDLIKLIAEQLPEKGTSYYLQSLFLVLRQMGYFFIEDSSPLQSQVGTLSPKEAGVAFFITRIRNAIGHRESKLNYALPSLKLIGAMNFKDNDVEIQYGKTRLFLLKDILDNHRRYRELFASAPELGRLSQHPSWQIEEQGLAAAEAQLTEKLSNPKSLLGLRQS